MSFDGLLRHTVTIYRDQAVLELGQPTYSELGQPITAEEAVGTWRCRIQPRTAREVAALHQAGAVVSDHVLFGRQVDIRTTDRLVEASTGRSFEVLEVPDAGGQGHHYEVSARLIASTGPAEPS